MKKFFSDLKTWFNSLPDKIQIIVYSGLSIFLAKLLSDLESGKPLNWREYIIIPLGVAINLVAYIIANKKVQEVTEDEFDNTVDDKK